MQLIKPYYKIETCFNSEEMLQAIERAGRTCYKSEDRITPMSAVKFIKMLIDRGHESVLEHEKITVRFIVDRGVSHEIVRHRISSFSQESTRYCNYGKGKFGAELTFIHPCWEMNDQTRHMFIDSLKYAEAYYMALLDLGWTPQEARSVLPNALKTEIVVTSNLRQWREIFRQRTSKAAHPQMREVMIPLLAELQRRIPIIFDDIKANQ